MPYVLGPESLIHQADFNLYRPPYVELVAMAKADGSCKFLPQTRYADLIAAFGQQCGKRLVIDTLAFNIRYPVDDGSTVFVRAAVFRKGQCIEIGSSADELDPEDVVLLCPLIC